MNLVTDMMMYQVLSTIDCVVADESIDCEFSSDPCRYTISTNSGSFDFQFGNSEPDAAEYGENISLTCGYFDEKPVYY